MHCGMTERKLQTEKLHARAQCPNNVFRQQSAWPFWRLGTSNSNTTATAPNDAENDFEDESCANARTHSWKYFPESPFDVGPPAKLIQINCTDVEYIPSSETLIPPTRAWTIAKHVLQKARENVSLELYRPICISEEWTDPHREEKRAKKKKEILKYPIFSVSHPTRQFPADHFYSAAIN